MRSLRLATPGERSTGDAVDDAYQAATVLGGGLGKLSRAEREYVRGSGGMTQRSYDVLRKVRRLQLKQGLGESFRKWR